MSQAGVARCWALARPDAAVALRLAQVSPTKAGEPLALPRALARCRAMGYDAGDMRCARDIHRPNQTPSCDRDWRTILRAPAARSLESL